MFIILFTAPGAVAGAVFPRVINGMGKNIL
jgi:hypothetical protein